MAKRRTVALRKLAPSRRQPVSPGRVVSYEVAYQKCVAEIKEYALKYFHFLCVVEDDNGCMFATAYYMRGSALNDQFSSLHVPAHTQADIDFGEAVATIRRKYHIKGDYVTFRVGLYGLRSPPVARHNLSRLKKRLAKIQE